MLMNQQLFHNRDLQHLRKEKHFEMLQSNIQGFPKIGKVSDENSVVKFSSEGQRMGMDPFRLLLPEPVGIRVRKFGIG